MLYCYRNFIFGWSLSGMTEKKGNFFMEMNILVWFFLTKSYKNELAISYLWSQDFLWWKIILVGKLTGCCEIYPFELSSAMSGDVVTEYTLWRTLLGKYCVMIYFISHLPLWLYWLILSHFHLWSPMCGLQMTLFVIFHALNMYSTCSYEFFSFFCYFFIFFSLVCWLIYWNWITVIIFIFAFKRIPALLWCLIYNNCYIYINIVD